MNKGYILLYSLPGLAGLRIIALSRILLEPRPSNF
jgi:hypothetical protein